MDDLVRREGVARHRLTEKQVDAVLAQLQSLLESDLWRKAPRQRRFLDWVVRATLSGDEHSLRGETLASVVFDRGSDFDSALDPIVRVEAGRMRSKLLAYYSFEGLNDPVRISIPKGAYRADFDFRSVSPELRRAPLTQGIGQFWSLSSASLQRAQDMFAAAVSEDPTYSAAHVWLALAAVNRHAFAMDHTLDSIQLAERHIADAMELDPGSAFVQAAHCATLIWSGRLRQAVRAGERTVALDPNYADGHAMLALALSSALELHASLRAVDAAFQLAPTPTDSYLWIKGQTLHLLGRIEEARSAYAEGVTSSGFGYFNRIGLALCCMQCGDLRRADEWVGEFRSWYPMPTMAFRNRFEDPTMRRRHSAAMRRLGFEEIAIR